MDMRSLVCFIAVAEELHFRRAAERLHLTQPALSQRIRVLEEEIGVALFERDRRQVRLTPAGTAFVEPVRATLASAGLARTQALRAARGEVGQLRLGFTVIAFYGVLPEAVQIFRSRFPEVVVELTEMNSPAVEAALDAGRLDIGVLHPPLATPGLLTRTLPDDRLVLAMPAGHRLARKRLVPLRELEDEPFLIAPRSVGPAIHDRVVAFFRAQGIDPRIVQEVTPMTTLTGLVAAGVGVGLVTEGIAAVGRPGVAFRPVSPPPPHLP
ncbi:MAG: LysR substrate-binding domain-containing protein, partial [Alphaproteobacteria bacterium]